MQNSRETRLIALRQQLAMLERGGRTEAVLPFGVPAIDVGLPAGGLPLGALHEIEGDDEDGAAATGFLAGVLARLTPERPVLWCLVRPDLYAPGLLRHGFQTQRLILVRASNDRDILWAIEEGLRSAALAAVVGEISALPMIASRRLQLAAEASGVTGFALHRRSEAATASAAVTRWRIGAVPGALKSGEPGVGQPQWRVDLARCRGGRPGSWVVEACDATGLVSLPATVADRPALRRRANE